MHNGFDFMACIVYVDNAKKKKIHCLKSSKSMTASNACNLSHIFLTSGSESRMEPIKGIKLQKSRQQNDVCKISEKNSVQTVLG